MSLLNNCVSLHYSYCEVKMDWSWICGGLGSTSSTWTWSSSVGELTVCLVFLSWCGMCANCVPHTVYVILKPQLSLYLFHLGGFLRTPEEEIPADRSQSSVLLRVHGPIKTRPTCSNNQLSLCTLPLYVVMQREWLWSGVLFSFTLMVIFRMS